ncbi:protein FAM228A isoform 5-T6 [Spinachia spinachia]
MATEEPRAAGHLEGGRSLQTENWTVGGFFFGRFLPPNLGAKRSQAGAGFGDEPREQQHSPACGHLPHTASGQQVELTVRGGREGGCVPVSRREEEEPCGKSKETGRGPGLWATAGSRLPRTTGGPDGHATGHRKGSSEGEKLHDSPPKGALLRVVFNVPPPKDLERFLSQRRVTELRRTELMHKRWTEREWLPLQRRVEERASTRGPAALKRRRSSYSHYLHHCNTKGFVFLDIFDLREYNPFRGDIKTPPLIKLSTGDLEEPHDRLEERGTPGSCEAGCKYTRKQVERRPQGDPPLCESVFLSDVWKR